jgi:DNA-directed RNA polymerase specialized sigma24 family protein
MSTSYAELQSSLRSRLHAGILASLQPLVDSAISFPFFLRQIKHCAVASLALLFSRFPCRLTASSILLRLSRRDAASQPPFGSLDTLLLMDLSAENYERLLKWLHPSREAAEKEYGRIRNLLVKRFQKQDCTDPDDLADATIDRIAEKLTTEKIENWVGPKERFFYSVGYYILLEARRKGSSEMQLPDGLEFTEPDEKEEESELTWQCFERCLQEQSMDKRELVVRYYRGTAAIKIKNRAELARDRGLSLPALRVLAGRIRQQLRACIERCLEDVARQSKHSLPM